MTDRWTSRPS